MTETKRRTGTPRPVSRPDDGRLRNPGGKRAGAGPKPKRRTLLIDGVLQDGLYTLTVTPETIILESVHQESKV